MALLREAWMALALVAAAMSFVSTNADTQHFGLQAMQSTAADGSLHFGLPLGVRPKQARRLDLQQRHLQQTAESPLLRGVGTHYAFLYVGTPPQRTSVIITTGSTHTAFPCKGCRACGTGTDTYWDPAASSTYKAISCPDCQTAPTYDSCSVGQEQCIFSQRYAEGSTWTAFEGEDMLYIGGLTLATTPKNNTDLSVELFFGCISSQTGLFSGQVEDGIMGLGDSEFNLVRQLKSAGLLQQEAFSLCLDKDGGSMVLGGPQPQLWTEPMRYSDLVPTTGRLSSVEYKVQVLDIKIGGGSIGTAAAIYDLDGGFTVDSGTTDTYLPASCSEDFRARWIAVTGVEYTNSEILLSAAAVAALPSITFVLAGGVEVSVLPEVYMDAQEGRGMYVSRIYLDEYFTPVLGANAMRNRDILFDITNQRLGFAPANCAREDQQLTVAPTMAPTMSPTMSTIASDPNFSEGEQTAKELHAQELGTRRLL